MMPGQAVDQLGALETSMVVGGTGYILIAIVGVGIALGVAIIPGLRELRCDVKDMGERIARLEGKVEVISSAVLAPETARRSRHD